MTTMEKQKKYSAALYLRLSQEDDDKSESDSISNQRELGLVYLKNHSEIELIETWIDDGYSGAHYFNRPSFNRMMESVKAGRINCIIVKDFSRLGRNFVETGKLIEKIFPSFGVRFISLNDNYDSTRPQTSTDRLMIPIRNLVNEFSIGDMSNNIRRILANKRQQGEYVAPFAMFGYTKDPQNKHRLVVDELSAGIVQEIFKMILEGYSAKAIAEILNEEGVPSPFEYKRLMGSHYQTPFKKSAKAKWSAQAVLRILKNRVYTGVLEQGKSSTPSYKVRKQLPVSHDEWAIVENTHEAIVSKEIFDVVAHILKSDIRTAPGQKTVYLLSGLLFCGDCQRSMVRKNNGSSDQPYFYYICSGSKEHSGCSGHSIRDTLLEETVFEAVKYHIKAVLDIEQMLNDIKELPYTSREIKKANERLNVNRAEIEKYRWYKIKSYEDYVDGVLTSEDYQLFAKRYDDKIQEAAKASIEIEKEIDQLMAGENEGQQWISYFKRHENIKELDRKLVVELIQRIFIFVDKRIQIEFRFQNQYLNAMAFLQSIASLAKEVV